MQIHVHVHNHNETREALATLKKIEQAFLLITNKLDQIMNKQERLEAAVTKIDAATNDIAGDLRDLKAQIVAGTVSDEALAQLEANATRLESIGAENPATGEPGTGEVPPTDPGTGTPTDPAPPVEPDPLNTV